MSPEYDENERRLEDATRRVWRIEEDRRVNGADDEERERAYASALGELHGYHFRDAELYHAEKGLPIPRRIS